MLENLGCARGNGNQAFQRRPVISLGFLVRLNAECEFGLPALQLARFFAVVVLRNTLVEPQIEEQGQLVPGLIIFATQSRDGIEMELKWDPIWRTTGAGFLSWNLGRSDLLNPSRHTNLLLLLRRLWACGHVGKARERCPRAASCPQSCRRVRRLHPRATPPSAANPGTRLAAVGIGFKVDVLALQAGPQPLDEDIAHPPAPHLIGPVDREISQEIREVS